MPRLRKRTAESHRREVRDAIIDATTALVGRHGIAAVTMAQIAEETGIGRATLYKYFGGVEAILVAGHERHVAHHLEALTAARERSKDPGERLEAMVETFAQIGYERSRTHAGVAGHTQGHRGAESHHPPGGEHQPRGHADMAALVHPTARVAAVQQRLTDLFKSAISDAANAGHVRTDIPPDELATFCLHSLASVTAVASKPAVDRLVTLTLAGLRPPSRAGPQPKRDGRAR